VALIATQPNSFSSPSKNQSQEELKVKILSIKSFLKFHQCQKWVRPERLVHSCCVRMYCARYRSCERKATSATTISIAIVMRASYFARKDAFVTTATRCTPRMRKQMLMDKTGSNASGARRRNGTTLVVSSNVRIPTTQICEKLASSRLTRNNLIIVWIAVRRKK
jgi:hypothetical protein